MADCAQAKARVSLYLDKKTKPMRLKFRMRELFIELPTYKSNSESRLVMLLGV